MTRACPRTILLVGLASALACAGSTGDGAPGSGGGGGNSGNGDGGGNSGGSGGRGGSNGQAGQGGGGPRDGGISDPDAVAMPSPGPNVDRSDPMLREFILKPLDLDPAVRDSTADQFAQLDTRAAPLARLVVFLPGANNTPADWRNHGRKLAAFGFHVLIPHYNNRWGTACTGMPGDCNTNTRWEAISGEDVSAAITASRADSVEGRVLAMLAHLVTTHPGGDWGYYLDGVGLRYERVIIAGISHGASSTGLYATRRRFWRAVMHSGGWGSVGNNPATPVTEYFGLSHTVDDQHASHLASWASAGLPGAPTSIDGAIPPYGGSHRLITSEFSTYPHCSVCVHSSSPMAAGMYVFEAAWRHMYGVAELTP